MRIEAAMAQAIAENVITALGAPEGAAASIAGSLIRSDLRRVSTHGLSLLPLYADLVFAGVIDPLGKPQGEPVSGCLGRVNGRKSFGQLTASAAVDMGLSMLAEHGIAAVGIEDGTHLGRLGEWAEQACGNGAAFLAFTNTAGGALNVTGPGSTDRILSTNPLAIGIPTFTPNEPPIIVDFATSQVAGSRIRELANAGGKLNPDWIVTPDGENTDDPGAFIEGAAALLPLGGLTAGHKGFGLMVACELLAALAGGMMAGERDTPWFSNGALFCFIDVARFCNPEQWGKRTRDFSDYLQQHGCRLPGTGHILADCPGNDHLDLPDSAAAGLLELAEHLAVDTQGLLAPAKAGKVTRTW